MLWPVARRVRSGERGAAGVMAAVGIALVLVVTVLTLGAMSGTLSVSAPLAGSDGVDPTTRPNVVVIVADDLDARLMPYVPNIRRLIGKQGATFKRFYVEQGTCCTSRATILSGQYAHNHHVEANAWPRGGFERWHQEREADALPTWLTQVGYRTALMGKYLNEYPAPPGYEPSQRAAQMSFVPPGWDDWMVPVQGNAYAQFHYRLNVNGEVQPFSSAYLDQTLGDHLDSLVDGANGFDLADGGNFLYYASYSPHSPYAHPAALDKKYAKVRYPHGASFDEEDVSDKFGMTRERPRLSAAYQAKIDRTFRDRIRSVQVLDANVGRLIADLKAKGALDNTYVMFLSDNGYNMGEHRREIGKYNQFEETVRVPFLVRGPGIKPGTVIDQVVGNTDIAPTVAAISGATPPYTPDGVNLLPLMTGRTSGLGRQGFLLGRALIPSYRTAPSPVDEAPEDYVANGRTNRLNDFTGVVTQRYKLVHYTHLKHEELYDLRRDPHELTNLLADDKASYRALSKQAKATVRSLRKLRERLVACVGQTCR